MKFVLFLQKISSKSNELNSISGEPRLTHLSKQRPKRNKKCQSLVVSTHESSEEILEGFDVFFGSDLNFPQTSIGLGNKTNSILYESIKECECESMICEPPSLTANRDSVKDSPKEPESVIYENFNVVAG